MESELRDEMLRYSEGLELKNKDRVLKKAVEICELFTTRFPERKIKRNVMLSSCFDRSIEYYNESLVENLAIFLFFFLNFCVEK